jgi:hypothetical protein
MKSAPVRVALLLEITSPRQPTGSEVVCLTPLEFQQHRDSRRPCVLSARTRYCRVLPPPTFHFRKAAPTNDVPPPQKFMRKTRTAKNSLALLDT